jgi:transposase InsO family protein
MKDALTTTMTTMPAELLRSLTWDRGKELSAHAQFKVDTGIAVYFADPHSPWQRGTNENTNGLLRQYFPKGTDLSRWNHDDLLAVQAAVNSRPRKVLAGRRRPKSSTSSYSRSTKPVLQPPVEPRQYTSREFADFCAENGVVRSMGRRATCFDNAVAESFFATYKKELIHTRPWNDVAQVRQHTFLWIEGYYNRRRRHSTLRYLTPNEYELGFRNITELAA